MELVLSLFSGAGLLDRGFEQSGFCVVSAGDILWGRDVRGFSPARHKFAGIIGGSPCQDFSKARRCPPTGEGLELVGQFARCVAEAQPDWFLLENVPAVPDIIVDGYKV
jgi:DNA (cytosine-5)-methyltransferase 1